MASSTLEMLTILPDRDDMLQKRKIAQWLTNHGMPSAIDLAYMMVRYTALTRRRRH